MKMGEVLPKGSIYEVNFGYTAKMEVYTNLSSDIPKLGETAAMNKRRQKHAD
jgi:hypothetical protein